jgi:hypothetical protein
VAPLRSVWKAGERPDDGGKVPVTSTVRKARHTARLTLKGNLAEIAAAVRAAIRKRCFSSAITVAKSP